MADDLDRQLAVILDGTVMKIKSNSDQIAKKHANKLAKTVKGASPTGKGSRKGHYRDGWTSRKVYENVLGSIEYEVRNTKKYRLTHLLEHGHIAADGTRVGERPHINANADEEIQAYIEDVKEHCTDGT